MNVVCKYVLGLVFMLHWAGEVHKVKFVKDTSEERGNESYLSYSTVNNEKQWKTVGFVE
jgi:hypothetical protein